MKMPCHGRYGALLRVGAVLFTLATASAHASFHLWKLNELFSNASGTIQYVELTSSFSGEQFIADHTLTSTVNNVARVYTFPSNLPGDSARKTMLIATEGFAALNLVTPDYVVPNGFFGVDGGTVDFAGVDIWQHPPLPTDGRSSLDRPSGGIRLASPFNFAGATATVDLTAAPAANYQGLWWRSPGGSENGWGVNVAQQGDVLFATWYTYDTDGTAMWLFSDARKTTGTSYTGQLYQATGAPFSAYDGARFSPTVVGNVTFAFADADNGTFSYTAKGVTQSKAITKFKFTTPVPTCVAGTAVSGTNYTDLWWRSPGGSENGWGVNLVHQGDIIFATWYTYGADGTDLWLVMDSAAKIADRTYRGSVYRTTSAPFNAYDPARFGATLAGTGTFTFSDASNGTFAYTVDGVTQSKPITRYVFATPPTACN
jgi:hypothetical protein